MLSHRGGRYGLQEVEAKADPVLTHMMLHARTGGAVGSRA
jgi:hypothetical protein